MSIEAGGTWVDSSPSNGLMYPAGGYDGPSHQNIGVDHLRWQPGPCGAQLPAWNPERAAATLSRFGGVMLVGDSIMQEQFHSLSSGLHIKVVTLWMTKTWYSAYSEAPVGSMTARPISHATMPLNWSTVDKTVENYYWNEPWSSEFLNGSYRLLIVNRGAHWAPDDVYIEELNQTLRTVESVRPDCLIVFRATVPGAPGCDNARYNNGISPSPIPSRYHWDAFEHQNGLVRELIRQHFPRVLFLDPVGPTMLRPDSRLGSYFNRTGGDCLHFAMPGPPDVWNLAILEGLAYFLDANTTNGSVQQAFEPVPRILHQTYYSKSKIHPKVAANVAEFAPHVDRRVYDDDDARAFLASNFPPAVYESFKRLKSGAHKADLLRYALLFVYGGLYMDIKTQLIEPLNWGLFPAGSVTAVLSNAVGGIYQGILASPPRHPLFLELIDHILATTSAGQSGPPIT